jgi:hypothetical protein
MSLLRGHLIARLERPEKVEFVHQRGESLLFILLEFYK